MNEECWIESQYELESKISKVLISISKSIPSKSVNNIDVLIFALHKRVQNNYNAINLLFRNGFFLESLMIIRSIIESTFVFNGFMENPEETYNKLLKLSDANKKVLHKKALNNQYLKSDAEKFNFENLDLKYISIRELSELSKKNFDLYDIAYKLISDDVHINLLSIESFIILEDEKIWLKDNLDIRDVEDAYFTLSYCMFMIEQGLNDKYKLGMDDEILEMEKFLEEMN